MSTKMGSDWRVRFEKYISPEPNTGCWLWTGAVNNKGYAQLSVGGKARLVHRLVAEAGSEVPVVMHTCDQPSCVNPAHLRHGTFKSNTADMIQKGRHRFGSSLITQEIADLIRDIRATTGLYQSEIGVLFGLHQMTISDILRGKAWNGIRQSR